MQIMVKLEGGPEVEVVARAIYAYNQFPGREASEVPWPPSRRQTLIRAWNMARVIVAAQHAADQPPSEVTKLKVFV